ncbi:hypothetical protein M501DRAFT_275042 [Patellaria atrata CBS 101060]|uniref:Uncharacterized protein n=1 Tax=Patellaria atrata CBS 101060 TaxID=1346257 RepID=A0A9P4S550_9PEZI|nr:hypothetical protein M501DRAFT_275042 [Patellaria atrata CBS 101060]
MAPNDSWITRTYNSGVSAAGNFTGTVINGLGNGVSGAGRNAGNSVTDATRNWGDTVKEYGNNIKNSTGATGSRSSTASNPLALARSKESVKIERQAKANPGSSTSGYQTKGNARNPLGLS